MAFTENLDTFFDASASGLAVQALFDVAQTPVNGYFEEQREIEAGMAGSAPGFLCKNSAVPNPVNKNLIVNSITYVIRHREPIDDGAIVKLYLQKTT